VAPSGSTEERRRRARLEARRRLAELRREEAAIYGAFPELYAADRSTTAARPGAPRPGSTMSPAMRRVVSERMKSYWAARRRAKNG
jgi:hypothetical protein